MSYERSGKKQSSVEKQAMRLVRKRLALVLSVMLTAGMVPALQKTVKAENGTSPAVKNVYMNVEDMKI